MLHKLPFFQDISHSLAFHFLVFGVILSFGGLRSLQAESVALIVQGIAGDESDAQRLQKLVQRTVQLLPQRGVSAAQIVVLPPKAEGKVTREEILARINAIAGKLKASDEFWLVLYGHSGRSGAGLPSFQLSGPRLTAEDLQKVLQPLLVPQIVFIATENSGAFLPFLRHANCQALSATAEAGEVNTPRFPEHWLDAMQENPRAPFAVLAAQAAARVEAECQQRGIGQGEHARLWLPAAQQILSPPFGVTDLAAARGKGPTESIAAVKPTEIQVTPESGFHPYKKMPATAETRRLLAAAKALPNPAGFSALMLQQDLQLTVNNDRSAVSTTLLRIYLARAEAADEWAHFQLPSKPPFDVPRVLNARTILPDGSVLVLDVQKASSSVTGTGNGSVNLQLPQAVAGCLLEINFERSQQPAGDIPEFYEELSLQHTIPVAQTNLTIKLPRAQKFNHLLMNLAAKQQESETQFSKILTWQLPSLPAWEPLPGDPPPHQSMIWLGLSSLESWKDFATWFRRLTQGSDASDPLVAQQAAALAAGQKNTRGKVQAVFEFVSSLRYVAIESGIQGFRPRTPVTVLQNRFGDCKDKANLLIALLRELKIPAQFVLINRGSSTEVALPGWQFNHAIAYLPAAPELGLPEAMWLDSTDTTTPFGSVAPGNLGRAALVLTADRAEFKTVTLPVGAKTTITETWLGQQASAHEWRGTVGHVWTGLADYHQRQTLSRLSPAQHTLNFSQGLGGVFPSADFSQHQLSDLSQLSTPLRLQSRWQAEGAPLLRHGLDFLDSTLAAPQRDRALVLNDGQPLAYRQTVRLEFTSDQSPTTTPPSGEQRTEAYTFSLQFRWLNPRTLERSALVQLTQPTIPASDYRAFRSAYRTWNKLFTQPLTHE